jgi:hypothetical protein
MSIEKEGNRQTSEKNDGSNNSNTEAYTTARLSGAPTVKCKPLTPSPRDRPLADIVSRIPPIQTMKGHTTPVILGDCELWALRLTIELTFWLTMFSLDEAFCDDMASELPLKFELSRATRTDTARTQPL